MIHNQNDTFTSEQKTTYTPLNSWTFVLEHSNYQKTCKSDDQRNMNSNICSFIADWELPQMEKFDVDKNFLIGN